MTNKEILNAYVGDTQVAKIYLGTDIVWPTIPPEPVYSAMPLTFEILTGGTIVWKSTVTGLTKTIEYSLNGGEWTTMVGNTAGTTVNVAAGDKIKFRGVENGYAQTDVGGTLRRVRFYGSTCTFKLYGNILSLGYGDDFEVHTAAKNTGGYNYTGMFEGTRVTDASNLILPKNLYADDLKYLFVNCTLLTTSPTIEADATTTRCLQAMFSGCTSLNYIKCLATDITGSNATSNWVLGVAATGTFVKHPDVTWPTGNNGIPTGWTVQDADI